MLKVTGVRVNWSLSGPDQLERVVEGSIVFSIDDLKAKFDDFPANPDFAAVSDWLSAVVDGWSMVDEPLPLLWAVDWYKVLTTIDTSLGLEGVRIMVDGD